MHEFLTGPLSVESVALPVSGLPDNKKRLRIAQLSDFHDDGLRLSDALLDEAIEAANAADVDAIALTGDFITHEPDTIDHLTQFLPRLRSRYGTYAVLGNHDIEYPGARERVIQGLEGIGIRVLWNEVIYPFECNLALVGFADFWSGEFKPTPVMETIPADVPRLVLSHNPDTAAILKRWRVDLQLSGHTHGGQIVIPGVGPIARWIQEVRHAIPRPLRPYVPYLNSMCDEVVRHWEWAEGLHRVGDNWLYVNRGLGTYFPGRLYCPPELTIVELVAALDDDLDPSSKASISEEDKALVAASPVLAGTSTTTR